MPVPAKAGADHSGMKRRGSAMNTPQIAPGDEALYDEAKAEGGEFFPVEVVDRLLAGENPIRAYRTYRGMTQKELAAAAGINPVYLSQIETGKRAGSQRTLTAMATALGGQPGDLV